MKRTAEAQWNGSIKEGAGSISTQSTTLNKTQYSFNARFADGVGTNPEELLGASHAGCFTMAVSTALAQAGFTANDLHTKATVELDVTGPKIAGIHLELTAGAIDGVSADTFNEIAEGAKANCPISKALSATPITLSVTYAG
ncbi:MAG: OsmC family peroxiredoxin [Sphingobacteriales bacterium]|nr:MAG: OsmC family peroxiredoxin [Sphingobacteriales bacterium]